MKKNKSKLLLSVMAVLMLATTGCSGNVKKTEGNATDIKEFTYWCSIPVNAVANVKSMEDMPMYQELEKRTGVKIKFIHPATKQGNEQFNLLIASRSFPDFIEYDWRNYAGGPGQAVNDNVIISLNDHMEKSAPNLSKVLQGDQVYDKQSKTDEGYYYGFPSINTGTYRCFGGVLLRKDWLDELGLEVPETIDEWETVLKAFKEKKGASAPFTVNRSMFDPTSVSANTFNTAFNVGKGFYLDGKTVKYAVIAPEYKEWIIRMRKWYKEGLLDNDYDTNSSAGMDAKMINGNSGACFGYVGSTIGRYMNAAASTNPKYNLVAAKYPVSQKGMEPLFAEVQLEANSPFLAITTACKDIEAAVKWADYLYSEEGGILKNFGIEGVTYNMVDKKPVYTDEILKNPAGLSISEAMGKNFRAASPGPGFNQYKEYLEQYYQLPQQKEAIEIWNKYIDNAKKTVMPPVTYTLKEKQELDNLTMELNTYIDEMLLKFVKGTEPMERYDDFIKTLNSMNIDRAIEINQNSVDRYFGRK